MYGWMDVCIERKKVGMIPGILYIQDEVAVWWSLPPGSFSNGVERKVKGEGASTVRRRV